MNLPLGYRRGGRNHVDEQPDTANDKRCARAKATYRNLQVLRLILAVQRGEAGDAAQRLFQIDLWSGTFDLFALY